VKKELLVIKLGGAVVTYKDSSTPKARVSTIKRLIKEIKQVTDQGYRIILVHGAGSFGHGLVKQYGLHHGMKTEEQKLVFGMVTNSMMNLNSIIKYHLHRANLKTVGLPPHTFITQSGGKLNEFETKLIETYLKHGQIPVLFGDMVLDDRWGCSVLSGDTIVCYLGNKLRADKVIFLSDVDGIFDADPNKNPQAKLIPEITNANISQVLKGLSPTGRDDVTGEMAGKILQIQKNLKQISVQILNGLKPDNLIEALGQHQIGTKLQLK